MFIKQLIALFKKNPYGMAAFCLKMPLIMATVGSKAPKRAVNGSQQ